MSSIYEVVVALLGEVPSGMEPVVYVFCMIIALFMVNCVMSVFASVFMGRGR